MTAGVIIGAARSGAGKTSVTIGLLRALRDRGLEVAGAKSGPDYIDPGFHAAASGAPGVNLDSWAMPPAVLDHALDTSRRGRDLVIVESAMGLFDGIDAPAGRSGAAADLARRYGLPVVLVLDISGQSRSAAAVAHGFASFDPAVSMAGVILNQVASDRHYDQAAAAIQARGIPVFGGIRRNAEMALPERHLGLVQAGEHADLENFVSRLAATITQWVNLDAVVAAARPLAMPPPAAAGGGMIAPPGQRIALARDRAFSFVYPHLLRHWRASGAEIVPFSPLADEAPARGCDVCWLPGGYPELHGGALAAAENFRTGMRRFAAGFPVHGECGGFMVLGAGLQDAAGDRHEMLGLLGHETSFAQRKMNLGYRRARLRADCPIGRAGTVLRGHEFHYSQVLTAGEAPALADLSDGVGRDLGAGGGRRGRVSGGFFHVIAGDG